MAPPGAAHVNYTMAGLVLVGGIAGFVKKGSIPSLVAGLSSAALYGFSATLMTDNPLRGFQLGTATSVLLAGAMGRRALVSRKFMPAGLIAALAISTGIYNGAKTYEFSS